MAVRVRGHAGLCVQEGTLKEKTNTLISQVRKWRPGEAQGESKDTRSEALLLCSFVVPSREGVWLCFQLHSKARGFKWNPKGYNGPHVGAL